MIIGLLLALLQAPVWSVEPGGAATVGDTVRLVRRLSAPPDVQVRLRPLSSSPLLEPLSAPRAAYAEGALTILYTVAFFEAGSHTLPMPDAELLYTDGRVEAVPGGLASVTITSVLPADDPPPPPLPARATLERHLTSPAPLAGLVLVVLVLAVLGGALWRRAGPRPPRGAAAARRPAPPIERWIAAGEPRAVAAVTADHLRERLAAAVPVAGRHLDTDECLDALRAADRQLPLRELSDVLHALERARFSPAVPSDVLELVERALHLVHEVETVPESDEPPEEAA